MKIAIHGPMCSGKTTIANTIIQLDNRYQRYSFGQKIKDIAVELFDMKNKDRSLLISIADKMRDIDADVWAKYILKTIKTDKCVIDDLRFQNELDYLQGWKIISLTTPKNERIKRIKKIYPDNFTDHIENMSHLSETSRLELPDDTFYLDTSRPHHEIKHELYLFIEKNKYR